MTLPTLLDDIWAKGIRGNQRQGETLHEHTGNVVRRLAQLRGRSPQLSMLPGNERLWHRLFWSCVLHDVGKAAKPFQAYLRGERPFWEHRHEVASLAFLPWIVDPGCEDFPWIAATIASHHRDASRIEERYDWMYPGGMALDSLLGEFDDATLEALAEWLATAPQTWIAEFGLDEAGIVLPSVASGRMGGAFRQEAGPQAVTEGLRAYARLRRRMESGATAMTQFGLLHRGTMLLADRLGSAHAMELERLRIPADENLIPAGARDHQRAAGTVLGSVLLTAPTGSGKTEAALIWARHQQAERPFHQTLIYLLPYQASLNAMHRRLKETLNADVGLLHGRSTLALFREFLGDGYNPRDAEREARRARDLAGLQPPAVQVATPYQLLRAAYRLPGYEMSWTGVHGAMVVADELHAYDPSRTGLIVGLLRRLIRDWSVDVCTVTATMPSWLRVLAKEAFGASEVLASADDFAKFRRHRLRLVDGDIEAPGVVDAIVQAVETGSAVLVGVNTVRRAQRVWRTLRARLGDSRTRLLHSRFTARDRLGHEESLAALCGLGVLDRRPVVVVATQTIEVSLNLDFDTIFSEPAPLEALAQRFGRVNRTGRLGLASVHVMTEPPDGQGVYEDELVRRTLDVLRVVDSQALDEARLSSLLDEAYGRTLSERFAAEVSRSQQLFERFCLDQLEPFQSDEQLEEQFDKLFDGVEVLPASLAEQYRAEIEDSPLEAQSLLVPIGYRQLQGLRGAGRVATGPKHTWVVDLPYDGVLGLDLVYERINSA